MKNVLMTTLVVMLAGSMAMAAGLDLTVRRTSDGASAITASPGEVIDFEIFGVLSSAADNEGLALFGLDLTFDGGDLDETVVVNPTADPIMANFTRNQGITNPDSPCPPACGFSGTIIAGDLVQIGGGQNTINNVASNAPYPVGGVGVTVAHPPAGQVLVRGSLTVPATGGPFTLSIPVPSVFANVIKSGELCNPDPNDPSTFCAAEAATTGAITNLTITLSSSECLASSDPPCGGSLWRSANNFTLLTFANPVTAPTLAGKILIRELQTGGTFGPDLSPNFTFTNDSPTVVRVTENGSVLTHRGWYAVQNVGGWDGVDTFKVDVVLQVGDAIANGRVLGADASAVNTGIPCFVNCPVRLDINGDTRVLGSDFSVVNTSIPSFPVVKPSGHACENCPG